MLSFLDPLRELTFLSVLLRLSLAAVCGGFIGLEREFKRRPAGFRTHILICLGAAITTLTSQFLFLDRGYYTDISRLGAQVVAGIGFIGAGTIVVTKRQHIRGLTTAAGLWASAIVGLCLGAGFFEGSLLATALLLVAELAISKLEYRMMDSASELNLYLEYEDQTALDAVLELLRERGVRVLSMEITRKPGEEQTACAIFTVRLKRSSGKAELLEQLRTVALVEEL